MALPGTTVTVRDSAPPRSAPTDSSVWFVTGYAERGPLTPQLIESMAEKEAVFGDRAGGIILHDSLDVYFREGGAKAYVSRVVGPTPVKASGILYDQAGSTGGDVALTATASEYGVWGNDIVVDVLAGSSGTVFVLQIKLDGVIVATSPDLADQTAAIAWAAATGYISLVAGASAEDPRVQTRALTGGADDHASATDANWKTAQDRFAPDLGPGQVSMPGRTTSQSYLDTLAHAAANRRTAILDGADTATVSTLTTAADLLRSDGRDGGMFAPWGEAPGVAGGTTRTVPYSAAEAGIIARNDVAGRSPNEAAAGELGQARYLIGLSQDAWSDADRETLNDAGVNVARVYLGGVRTYGYRTLTDPDTDENWKFLTTPRLVKEIEAQGLAIGERYVFGQVDGRGLLLGDYAAELRAMLTVWYDLDSLYGETVDEAFSVDVGPQINPPSQLADGVVSASVELRISPVGERVGLFITNRAITEVI